MKLSQTVNIASEIGQDFRDAFIFFSNLIVPHSFLKSVVLPFRIPNCDNTENYHINLIINFEKSKMVTESLLSV